MVQVESNRERNIYLHSEEEEEEESQLTIHTLGHLWEDVRQENSRTDFSNNLCKFAQGCNIKYPALTG